MAMAEKVRILLVKRKITVTDLAKRLGMSQSNLSNKLSRDNFNEKELQAIADALDCDLDIDFILRDTGEKV